MIELKETEENKRENKRKKGPDMWARVIWSILVYCLAIIGVAFTLDHWIKKSEKNNTEATRETVERLNNIYNNIYGDIINDTPVDDYYLGFRFEDNEEIASIYIEAMTYYKIQDFARAMPLFARVEGFRLASYFELICLKNVSGWYDSAVETYYTYYDYEDEVIRREEMDYAYRVFKYLYDYADSDVYMQYIDSDYPDMKDTSGFFVNDSRWKAAEKEGEG